MLLDDDDLGFLDFASSAAERQRYWCRLRIAFSSGTAARRGMIEMGASGDSSTWRLSSRTWRDLPRCSLSFAEVNYAEFLPASRRPRSATG
jgi:hypothetical protein